MGEVATAEPTMVRALGADKSSLDRAAAAAGGWHVPVGTEDEFRGAVQRLSPSAVDFRRRWADAALVADQVQVEFLRAGPKLLNVEAVGGLPKLRGLACSNGWTGVLPLGDLDALRWLRMDEVPAGKARERLFEVVRPNLRVLNLVTYPFETLGPLVATFPNLEYLSIGRSSKLVSLDGIGALASTLRGLQLFYDSKLEGLGPLVSLEVLEALKMESVRGATDLASLRKVSTLRYLSVEVPRLASLHPLDGHPGLEVLVTIARIEDSDPSPLAAMPQLQAYQGSLWNVMAEDSPLLERAGLRSPTMHVAVRAWNG